MSIYIFTYTYIYIDIFFSFNEIRLKYKPCYLQALKNQQLKPQEKAWAIIKNLKE